ncbi:hypothetical protein A3Q56_06027 [Intoshia linei]|uniref:Uncharacterized protein n=1 Tax=Intoshia linei TaxID=1819745 RepID=A0A177AW81_9BILA|nr:hypothetical protein A3Q56_06027 [Intoshia linei]
MGKFLSKLKCWQTEKQIEPSTENLDLVGNSKKLNIPEIRISQPSEESIQSKTQLNTE